MPRADHEPLERMTATPTPSALAQTSRPGDVSVDTENARRFLDACATIEEALVTRYGLAHVRGLGEAIEAVGTRDKVLNRHHSALRAFLKLRNALSHAAYEGGRPIANPLPTTVAQVERVAREITSPTQIRTLAAVPSSTVSRADALAPALTAMVDLRFSQVLVVDDDHDVTVLTTNTIARWMANHLESDGSLLIEGATVGEVLIAAERERVVAVRPTESVAAVIELFGESLPPRAVVISPGGTRRERPTGIVVVDDLPRLHDVLQFG